MNDEKKPRFITGEIVEEESILTPESKKEKKEKSDKGNDENEEDDPARIVKNFISTLADNMQDSDPQFSRLVDKHFWEILI